MTKTVRYLSHPDVVIDPNKSPEKWGLNAKGASRVQNMVAQEWAQNCVAIISSAEQKAIDTAMPFVAALGVGLEIRPLMHENDRSATGYLPREEFEQVADEFFAHPDRSVRGWETAQRAQRRILSELNAALKTAPDGDLLFVGHGAVGTLLICHLEQIDIDRKHDQPPTNGGNFFAFERESRKLLHPWQSP